MKKSLHFRPSGYVKLAASLFVTGLLVSTASVAQAQVVVPPGQSNPGLIIRPEEKQLYDDKSTDKQQQIEEKPEDVKIEVPEQEGKGGSAAESPRFLVSKISLEGNHIFSQADLQAILSKYEGRELNLDDLGMAVDEINQYYRTAGYLTSQAYVPPQDIDNGQVKIQIVEGVVGDLSITGAKYVRPEVIQGHLRYHSGDVLNIPEREKTLNRINQQQNYRLKAILKAGDETGETDVSFQVAERQPWQISPTFDNQGRPFVGTMRWGAELQNQNLLGYGDRLFIKWLGAARTQVAAASYAIPLNRYGTELAYSYSFSYVDVDLHAGQQPKIEGFANNHTLTVSQPLDSDRMFTLDAGVNFRRVTTTLDNVKNDGANQSQVDLRTLTFGLNFNKMDKWGRTFLRAQTDVGIGGWLSSNRSFWKASMYGTRLHRLPWNSLLILRGAAQFTPDALAPIEQFQIGGAFSVRGFSEGLLIGDRGYNLGAEVRFPVPGLKYVSPWLADRIQGAGFVDMGQVWFDRSNPNFNPDRFRDTNRTLLMGAGLGVRARLTRFLIGFTDFGWGITNQQRVEPFAQPTVRVHFGVRSDLLPDDYKTHGQETTALKGKGKKQKAIKPPASASKPATTTEKKVAPSTTTQPQKQPVATTTQKPTTYKSKTAKTTTKPATKAVSKPVTESAKPAETTTVVPATAPAQPTAVVNPVQRYDAEPVAPAGLMLQLDQQDDTLEQQSFGEEKEFDAVYDTQPLSPEEADSLVNSLSVSGEEE